MRRLLVLPALLALAAPASAWSDLDRMTVSNALGSLLGSETACGLAFDQAAVSRYIDDKVPADDMQFASMLNMMAGGTEAQIADMSASQKTAHCRQIERAAKSHGFIK